MTCPECNREAGRDPETGYDADTFCSRECEEKFTERERRVLADLLITDEETFDAGHND